MTLLSFCLYLYIFQWSLSLRGIIIWTDLRVKLHNCFFEYPSSKSCLIFSWDGLPNFFSFNFRQGLKSIVLFIFPCLLCSRSWRWIVWGSWAQCHRICHILCCIINFRKSIMFVRLFINYFLKVFLDYS